MVQSNLNTFTLTLINTTGQTLETHSIPLNSTNPIAIQIGQGTIIRLQDDETGLGPKTIVAKRVGDDLHIYFEDGDELVDIIIEDYYLNPEILDIQGEVTEGEWVSYFPEEGDAGTIIAQLDDGSLSGQILQGSFESAFSPLTLLGLAGVVGAGVAIAANNNSNDSNPSPAKPQNPTDVTFSENTNANDREIALGKTNPTIDTNDATPILKGATTPGTTIEIAVTDKDGKPIKVDNGNGVEVDLVYTTQAGPDGKWEIEIGAPGANVTGPILTGSGLPDGNYKFEIKQSFPDGSRDEKTADVTVDTVNPISTTFSITDNAAGLDYFIASTPVIQAFGLSDAGGTLIISLPQSSTTTISARTSNPSVEIEFSKDENGVWRVDFSDPQTRDLFINAFPGGFSSDTSYHFAIKDKAGQEVTFTGKVVDGSNIKNITVDLNSSDKSDKVQGNLIINDIKPALTNDDTPKLTGTVNSDSINKVDYIKITVTPIDVMGNPIGKDIEIRVPGNKVDQNGNWQYLWDENNALPNGIYNFNTVIVSKSGNESKPEDHKIEIKSIRPQPIDIDSLKVGDDVGSRKEDNVLDDRYLGNQTDDARPTISGEAEIGNNVIVTIKTPDGTVVTQSPKISVTDSNADGKGDWRYTPDTDLPPGDYIIEVSQINPLDTEERRSPPINVEITVGEDSALAGVNPKDVIIKDDEGSVKEANVLDNNRLGNSTDDTKPTFSGKLKPEDPTYPGTNDHTVEITLKKPDGTIAKDDNGNNLTFKVPVDKEGNWTFTPANPIPDGDYKVEMVEKDAGGKSSPKTQFPLTIDTKVDVPVFKVIDDVEGITGTVLNKGLTNDTHPTLSGKAEPNAEITIVIKDKNGNNTVVTTKADTNGNWQVDAGLTKGDGKYTLSVTQTDAAGNTSAPKEHIINLNTKTPDNVTDIKVADDFGDRKEGNVLDNTYQGNATDDNKPMISGKGEPGGSVTITVTDPSTGKPLAVYPNIPVDKDGNWTFTPKEALKDGNYEFAVKQTGVNGQTSGDETFQLKIDTQGKAVGDIAISDNENPRVENNILDGTFAGSVTDDKTPTLSGSGTPGNQVELAIVPTTPGAPELKVTVPVDNNGKWSYTPAAPGLADGNYTIVAKERDQSTGATGPEKSVDISIDSSTPPALAMPKVEDNQNIADGNILDGNLPGEVTDDTTPTLKGQGGVPNGEVNITLKNTDTGESFTGKANVDGNGNWQFTPSPELPEGHYEATLNQTGLNGKPSPDTKFDFKIDTSTPSAPITDLKIGDDVGPRLEDNILTDGSSPSGGYPGNATNDAKPTFSGKTDPENGVLIVIKPTDPTKPPISYNVPKNEIGADGSWKFTPPDALADGDYKVEIFPTKPETGLKGPGTEVDLTIDTQINAPTLKVVDDVEGVTGPVVNNGITNDKAPTLSGQAEPNAEISIVIKDKDGNKTTVTTKADANGNWQVDAGLTKGDGKYTLSVTQTDAAGNVSAPTDHIINLSTKAPDNVTDIKVTDDFGDRKEGNVLDNTYQGNATDDNKPMISGKGEPGGSVTITVTDPITSKPVAVYPNIPVDENGNWSFTPNEALKDGNYEFAVKQTGVNGETSGNETFQLKIDTQGKTVGDVAVSDNENPRVENNILDGTFAGSVTDDKTPTLSGSGTPGNQVELAIVPKTPGAPEIKVSVPVDADGKWSYTPTAPGLNDGNYTIIAKERDQGTGAAGPEKKVDISIDTTTPPALSIPKIEDNQPSVTENNILDNTILGNVTDDTTPTLKGQGGVPNNEVNITFKNIDTGTTFTAKTNVDENGNWQFTPPRDLPDGNYEVTLNQTGVNGKPSLDSKLEFKIDTSVPANPITDLKISDDVAPRLEDNILTNGPSGYPGNKTDDTKPTFSGKTEPGTGVLIVINPTDLTKPSIIYNVPKTEIGADGSWSFTPPDALADGDYKVEIFPTKPETGAKGPATKADLTIDTTTPPKLADFKVSDNVGPRVEENVLSNPPTSGAFVGNATDDNTPTISGGDAIANGEVEITFKRNGQPDIVAKVPVGSDGKWSYTPENPLADGDYTIELKQIGLNGKPSAPETFPLVIDTSKPSDVSNLALKDDVDARKEDNVFDGTFEGNATNDTKPTLSGKGTPGDIIEVMVVKIDPITGIETPVETKQVIVDGQGNWKFENSNPFVEGEYQYQITPINPNTGVRGNTTEKDFTIDTSNGGLADIKLEDDVDWIGKDGIPKPAQTIPDGTAPLLEGKGKPNETITVEVTDKDGNKQHLETKVDPNGNWKLDLSTNPAVKDGGTFTPPTGGDYTVNVVPTPLPAIYPTIIDGITNDNNPTVTGKGEPNADIEVKVLDKDGQPVKDGSGNDIIAKGKVDNDGNFSVNPGELPDGEYVFEISSTDTAGNQTPSVKTPPIIIDTLKPGNVVFTVEDDVKDQNKIDLGGTDDGTGIIENGKRTNDKRPEIKGSNAEPGNTINVLVMDKDGNLLEPDLSGKAIVDAEGNWSYLIPVMRDGEYQIVTTQTDKAGNTSDVPESAKINFTVNADLFYPSNIEYSDSVFGDITKSTTPTISGLGKPGDDITVTVKNPDGSLAFTENITVGADGKWSVTSPVTLAPTADFNDPYQVYVTGKNEWGDELVVPPLDLIIDNSAPSIGIKVDNISNAAFDSVANKFSTNDTSLIFYGTIDRALDKHETMEIFLQGGWRKINPEDIVLGDDGKYHWSYDNSNQPFAIANYTLDVRVIDAFGRASNMLAPPSFNVTSPTYAQKPTLDLVVEEDIASDSARVKGVNKETVTSDSTPILSGTGVAGDTIKIYVDGKDTGQTAIVRADGKWQHELSSALKDGKHTLSVTSVNGGSESAPSDNYEIVVDTTAPTATVTLDNISANTGDDVSVTDDNTLYFFLNVEGELAKGETVQIKIGDNEWANASQLPDGRWIYDNTGVELPDGEYDIKTRVIDKFGRVNESDNKTIGGTDKGYTFKIDTSQSVAVDPNLKISSIDADAPDRETIINDNLYLNDNTPTIIGEGTPGDIIVIYSNGKEIGTTTVYEDGLWEFNMPYQVDGAYLVSVASGQANELGELDKATLSRPTNAEKYVVDTTPPNVMVNMTGVSVDSGAAGNRRTSDDTLILYGQISQALKEGESLQVRLWQNSASIFNGSTYVVDPELKIAMDTGWITVKAEDIDNGTLKWVFDFANSEYAKSQEAVDQGIINGKLPLSDGNRDLGTSSSNGKPQINIEFRVVDEFNRAQISPPDFAKIVPAAPAPFKDGYFGEFNLNSDQGVVIADAEVQDNTLTLSGKLDMSKIILPAGTDGYTITSINVIIHLNGQPFLSAAQVNLTTGAWSYEIPALKAGNYEISMSLNLGATNAPSPNLAYESRVTDPFYFKVVNPDVTNLVTATSEMLIDLVPDDSDNLNIIGSKQNDVLSLTHLQFDEINGSDGLDTLKVENKLSIDLTSYNDTIHNIEIFDLNNTGSELKVTYNDILKTGTQDHDLLQSQFNFADIGIKQDASIMLIEGSEHDLVSLDSILGNEQVKSIGKVENMVNHEFYDVYQVAADSSSQQFAYLILDEQLQFNHF